MPRINWMLLVGVLPLVLGFRSSSELAAAYGIAVTGTMVITSRAGRLRRAPRWGWSRVAALPLLGAVPRWSTSPSSPPTWSRSPTAAGSRSRSAPASSRDGDLAARPRGSCCGRARRRLAAARASSSTLDPTAAARVPGTAVFLTGDPDASRTRCCTTSSTTRCCTSACVLLTVGSSDVPVRAGRGAGRARGARQGLLAGGVRYGFMDRPDIPRALAACRRAGARRST